MLHDPRGPLADKSWASNRRLEQQWQVDHRRAIDKGAGGGCGADGRLRGGDNENGGPVRDDVRHVRWVTRAESPGESEASAPPQGADGV